MNKRKLSNAAVALIIMASGAIASCSVDSDYDLSDVDSTMKFEAKDLIIPMKVDTFDLEEQDKVAIDYALERQATYIKDWDDWASEDLSYLVIKSGVAIMTIHNCIDTDMDVTFSLNGHSYVKSETDNTLYDGENSLSGKVSVPADGMITDTIPLTIKNGIGVADIYGATITAKNPVKKIIPESSKITVMSFKIKVNGYYSKEF